MPLEQTWVEFNASTPSLVVKSGVQWLSIEVPDWERRTRWRFWWVAGHHKPQMDYRLAFMLWLCLAFGATLRVAFRHDPAAPIVVRGANVPVDVGGVEVTFPDGSRYEIVIPP